MPKESSGDRGVLHHLPSFRSQTSGSSAAPSAARRQSSLINHEDPVPIAPRIQSEDIPPFRRLLDNRRLGGRGREWAPECLKLLQALLELDDSKPFRQPVDPSKYPGYYSVIQNPIDLSKVMLKFHGGKYSTVDEFAGDMRDMFNDYKTFFKDPNSQIYTQIHRISWWFEAELARIKELWTRGRIGAKSPKRPGYRSLISKMRESESAMNIAQEGLFGSSSQRTDSPHGNDISDSLPRNPPPAHTPLSYEQILRHSRSFSAPNNGLHMPGSGGVPSSQSQAGKRVPPPAHSSSLTPVDNMGSGSEKRPHDSSGPPSKRFQIGSSNNRQHVPVNSQPSRSAPQTGKSSTTAASLHDSVARLYRKKAAAAAAVAAATNIAATANAVSTAKTPSAPPPGSQVPNPSSSSSSSIPHSAAHSNLELQLDASNVWYGVARNRPTQQVRLTEAGVHTVIQLGGRSIPFEIKSEEILRCCAHFGRSRKHTLFLFVTPTCSRRLEALGDKFKFCSLIVLFLNALTMEQISRMIHIFWAMSRNSIFGPLFSEVDQKSALCLLANIKPAIMNRVADKFRGSSDLVDFELNRSGAVDVGLTNGDVPERRSSGGTERRNSTNTVTNNEADATNNVPSSSVDGAGSSSPARRSSSEASTSNTTPASRVNATGGDEAPATSSAAAGSSTTAADNASPAAMLSSALSRASSEQITTLTSTMQESIGKVFQDPQVRRMLQSFAAKMAARGFGGSSTGENSDAADLTKDMPLEDEESDIEIIMPSDSEDEADDADKSVNDELVMTKERKNVKCPILQQTMQHPVKNKHCGHGYDRHGVEELIRNRGDKARCPVAGCSNDLPLNMMDMNFDLKLWKHIQAKKSTTDND